MKSSAPPLGIQLQDGVEWVGKPQIPGEKSLFLGWPWQMEEEWIIVQFSNVNLCEITGLFYR